MSYGDAARKFNIPRSTISSFIKHWKETESIESIGHGGLRHKKITDDDVKLLKEWLEKNP